MTQPFWRAQLPSIAIGLLNVFAIGLGMGIPVFAIAFGFPVGWYFASVQLRAMRAQSDGDLAGALGAPEAVPVSRLNSILGQAVALTVVTFVVMAVVWGSQLPTVFDPAQQAADWGIPLILYTSQASKVGWLLLMLMISPLAQFMAVITGAYFRLTVRPRRAA